MKASGYIKSIIVFTVLLYALGGCTKGSNPDESSNVPNVSVNITININTSTYNALTKIGGVVNISGGYRGILLYRVNSGTIVAFDRTCTYDISDVNGIVQSQTNGTAICLECGSTYNLVNGNVYSGPTTIGLKSYNASFNTGTGILTVTN